MMHDKVSFKLPAMVLTMAVAMTSLVMAADSNSQHPEEQRLS